MKAISQTTQPDPLSPQWNIKLKTIRKTVPKINTPINNPKAIPQITVPNLNSIIFMRIVIYLSSSGILSKILLFGAQFLSM